MNAFSLKLFAVITMIIDHVGLFFFPQEMLFRAIGRLSFPLFAWLIANGAQHTHDIRAYGMRILVLALISQIPYILANRQIIPTFTGLNVLFTLGLGLIAIILIQKTKNRQAWVLIAVICGAVAQLLLTDYGLFGVLVVVCFYLFYNNFKYLLISQLFLFLFPYIFLSEYRAGSIEPLGLFSLLFIGLYNKQEGPKLKYWFYLVYPLQYIAIFLVQLLG